MRASKWYFAALVAVSILFMAALVYADTGAAPDPSDVESIARFILANYKDVGLALCGGLLFVVWAIKKFSWPKWFATRWGGWTLNMTTAVAGALITARLAGVPWTGWTILSGVFTALAAAGALELLGDIFKSKKNISGTSS